MKIALVGYGKMGRAIEKVAINNGHEIAYRIGSQNREDIHLINRENTDVVIEFSVPDAAPNNILTLVKAGIPVACGTTAWLDQWDPIEEAVLSQNSAFIYASNFSIGVNMFFAVNKYLATLMNRHRDYAVDIREIHHTEKLDKPSGTAISLANDIVLENKKYSGWHLDSPAENKLTIFSERIEHVPGTHVVHWQNEIDQIELRHTANTREGFAKGAVLAAEWLVGKKGIFTMNDVLNIK